MGRLSLRAMAFRGTVRCGLRGAVAALALPLIGALTACSAQSEAPEVALGRFDVAVQQALSDESPSPKCELTFSLCYVEGVDSVAFAINSALAGELFRADGQTLRHAADSFAAHYAAQYVDNLTPFYAADQGRDDRLGWYEYWFRIATEAHTVAPRYLVYTANEDIYEGGAHSVKQRKVLNFDTTTGRCLSLGDLLVEGYEPKLTAMLLQKLHDKAATTTFDELRAKGFLVAMDMFIAENFAITDRGLTFVYNPYEIAPYDMGTTELHLSRAELGALLR